MYAVVSFAAALTLPRFEQGYFASYVSGVSVASAQAFFAAVASGMIALTGIVFSVGLVMVQFSAMAYSPRLVLLFARDPMLFHSLGVFIATFLYSLGALAWVDREGSGIVPLFSAVCGRWVAFAQHAALFSLDKGPERPSDHERTSRARRQRPRDHSRDVPGPRRKGG